MPCQLSHVILRVSPACYSRRGRRPTTCLRGEWAWWTTRERKPTRRSGSETGLASLCSPARSPSLPRTVCLSRRCTSWPRSGRGGSSSAAPQPSWCAASTADCLRKTTWTKPAKVWSDSATTRPPESRRSTWSTSSGAHSGANWRDRLPFEVWLILVKIGLWIWPLTFSSTCHHVMLAVDFQNNQQPKSETLRLKDA